jgi:coenzyme F420-dependent glucose-6-phosphate dehydrogenase
MDGGLVTFQGKYYQVKDSNLYTKPLQPIPIFVAGIGPQSARLAGQEADGFVTNEVNPELIESNFCLRSEMGQGRPAEILKL